MSVIDNVTSNSIASMMEQYGIDTSTTTSSSDGMDKDAFLNILVTQMQYQDPLEPTTNEDFLAQMAQFSSLEQMQNLNTSFAMQQAYELVGKSVIGLSVNSVTSESTYVEGTVESVTLKNGETYLSVDGVDVLLADVEAVINNTTSSEDLTTAISEINASLTEIKETLATLTDAEASETTTDEATTTTDATDTTL